MKNICLKASDTKFLCLGMIWVDQSGIWPLYYNVSTVSSLNGSAEGIFFREN